MRDRVFSLETEYAVSFRPAPGSHGGLPDAAEIVAALQHSLIRKYGILRSQFLTNGSKFHLDVGHAEWSLPECRSAREAVLYDKAAAQALADSVANATAGLAQAGHLGSVLVIKNNVDPHGNTYGCHENYMVDRATEWLDTDCHWRATVRFLTPFLVTRQVLCGSGRFGLGMQGERAGFQISQRADFISRLVSSETRSERGIVNTGREREPLAPSRYRRLHLILGDANVSDWSTFLKLGTTGILLRMIEEIHFRDIPHLVKPVEALWQVSHDPSCQTGIALRGGGEATAIDIQRQYLRQAEDFLKSHESSASERAILQTWGEALESLEQDPSRLFGKVDWVTKKLIMERYLRKNGLEWGQLSRGHEAYAELLSIDLRYHDVSSDGLFSRLVARGEVQPLIPHEEIARAMEFPPAYTRAWVRGTMIKMGRAGQNVTVDGWEELSLGQTAVQLKEPLAFFSADAFRIVRHGEPEPRPSRSQTDDTSITIDEHPNPSSVATAEAVQAVLTRRFERQSRYLVALTVLAWLVLYSMPLSVVGRMLFPGAPPNLALVRLTGILVAPLLASALFWAFAAAAVTAHNPNLKKDKRRSILILIFTTCAVLIVTCLVCRARLWPALLGGTPKWSSLRIGLGFDPFAWNLKIVASVSVLASVILNIRYLLSEFNEPVEEKLWLRYVIIAIISACVVTSVILLPPYTWAIAVAFAFLRLAFPRGVKWRIGIWACVVTIGMADALRGIAPVGAAAFSVIIIGILAWEIASKSRAHESWSELLDDEGRTLIRRACTAATMALGAFMAVYLLWDPAMPILSATLLLRSSEVLGGAHRLSCATLVALLAGWPFWVYQLWDYRRKNHPEEGKSIRKLVVSGVIGLAVCGVWEVSRILAIRFVPWFRLEGTAIAASSAKVLLGQASKQNLDRWATTMASSSAKVLLGIDPLSALLKWGLILLVALSLATFAIFTNVEALGRLIRWALGIRQSQRGRWRYRVTAALSVSLLILLILPPYVSAAIVIGALASGLWHFPRREVRVVALPGLLIAICLYAVQHRTWAWELAPVTAGVLCHILVLAPRSRRVARANAAREAENARRGSAGQGPSESEETQREWEAQESLVELTGDGASQRSFKANERAANEMVDHLIDALESNNPAVRAQAVRGLAETGDREAGRVERLVDQLIACARLDSDLAVRLSAVEGLKVLGGPLSEHALRQLMTDAEDSGIRWTAEEALDHVAPASKRSTGGDPSRRPPAGPEESLVTLIN